MASKVDNFKSITSVTGKEEGASPSVKPIGGEQSAKDLLDQVLEAVVHEDYDKLRDLQQEFNSVPQNVDKCRDSAGNTLTHLALGKDTHMLQFVLSEFGANINAVNRQGKTALHEAVRNNYVACCKFLLAQPDIKDDVACNTLSTPFHTAAACGSVECMEALLAHLPNRAARIARINEQDKNKCTALLKCTYDGDIAVVRWLIKEGADCLVKDINDNTALLVATMRGREDIVDELLALGSERYGDINDKDIDGNTAIHHCAIRCLPRICEKIIAEGGDVLKQNNNRCNPLHLAAMNAKPENPEWARLVLMLIRKGGETLLKQENSSKKTPIDLVSRVHRPLFTVAEVQKQEEAQKKQVITTANKAAEAAAAIVTAIDAIRANQAAIDQAAKDEEERCAKEAEERLHHEDNVRSRHEEKLEMARKEAEEAERLKREAKMKKDKGAKAGAKAGADPKASSGKASPKKGK